MGSQLQPAPLTLPKPWPRKVHSARPGVLARDVERVKIDGSRFAPDHGLHDRRDIGSVVRHG